MHDSLEIEKKDNGYSVDIMSEHDDEYDLEALVFQDPLDVLAEVLRWLGYDEDTIDAVTEMLDDDVAYELTDKGRETLARLERERADAGRLAALREVDAMKRGPGRGNYWVGDRHYETTTTGR